MRTKIVAAALAGTVGLAGAALLAPGVASAQPGTGHSAGDRVSALKEVLTALVADGTLNQTQADKVAKKLVDTRAETRGKDRPGHPGRGHGPGGNKGGPRGAKLPPAAVAAALGIEVGELRAEQRAGKTIAQIAQEKGLSPQALLDTLVAAAETRLADEVASGELTQTEADERRAGLAERIGKAVDQPGRVPGHRGPGTKGPAD